MKSRKKLLCSFLALVMMITVFNANTMQIEAISRSSKTYKAAMKERKKFKQEAEYYGYSIFKDEMVSRTSKKVKWHYEVQNCESSYRPDSSEVIFYVDVYQETEKQPKGYGAEYDSDYWLGGYHAFGREYTVNFLKSEAMASSIRRMLVRRSKSGANSLKKDIKAKKGTVSENTSKYVKSDKTGRSNFTATNAKGKKYDISVRYHRGKKRGQIIAKYYLNGKASTKKKILKKF